MHEHGAHLQMRNQLDLDIRPHRKFLDGYTSSTLEQQHHY